MTSRWGWPARINYVQTMFIPLLTCTLFEPHDYLVHSSPQCDNASEKAMHYIGRRRYSHPTAIFSFSRIVGDPVASDFPITHYRIYSQYHIMREKGLIFVLRGLLGTHGLFGGTCSPSPHPPPPPRPLGSYTSNLLRVV